MLRIIDLTTQKNIFFLKESTWLSHGFLLTSVQVKCHRHGHRLKIDILARFARDTYVSMLCHKDQCLHRHWSHQCNVQTVVDLIFWIRPQYKELRVRTDKEFVHHG